MVGNVAVLGEPSEQRFGGVAVLGRFGAESGEGAAPRGDRGDIRYRGRVQPLGGGSLFGPVLVEQLRWAGSVGQPDRVDDPGADRRVPLGDRVVVGEHANKPPVLGELLLEMLAAPDRRWQATRGPRLTDP